MSLRLITTAIVGLVAVLVVGTAIGVGAIASNVQSSVPGIGSSASSLPSPNVSSSAAAGLPSCPMGSAVGAASTTTASPGLLDVSVTQILVCRYFPLPSDQSQWQFDTSRVFTGSQARTLIEQINSSPVGNPNQRCISGDGLEMWMASNGGGVVTSLRLQLGGCGFTTDGVRTVLWQHPDPIEVSP